MPISLQTLPTSSTHEWNGKTGIGFLTREIQYIESAKEEEAEEEEDTQNLSFSSPE